MTFEVVNVWIVFLISRQISYNNFFKSTSSSSSPQSPDNELPVSLFGSARASFCELYAYPLDLRSLFTQEFITFWPASKLRRTQPDPGIELSDVVDCLPAPRPALVEPRPCDELALLNCLLAAPALLRWPLLDIIATIQTQNQYKTVAQGQGLPRLHEPPVGERDTPVYKATGKGNFPLQCWLKHPIRLRYVSISTPIEKGTGGGGVWNVLISKNLAHYSLSLNFCLFFKHNPLFFKMLIDFRQFLCDSVEKVLFKADFFFCMTEMRRQTLAHNLNIQFI